MSVQKDYPNQIRFADERGHAMHIDLSGHASLPPIHLSVFVRGGHVNLFVSLQEAREIVSRINFVIAEVVSEEPILGPEDFEDTDQDPLAA